MKKIFLVTFLTLSLFSFSQVNELGLHLGCYSNGDTLTMNGVKRTIGINILGEGSEKYSLKQWNMVLTFKNNKTHIFKPDPKTPTVLSKQMKEVLLDKFKVITKVEIQNIIISDNKNDKNLNTLIFYLNDRAYKSCDEKTAKAKDDLMLKFSCFKNGEEATVKDLLHYPTFSIINYNPKVNVKIISFNFVVPKMDQRRNPKNIENISNSGIELNSESFELAKKLVQGEEFILNNINVEFSNPKTKTKETVVLPPIKIIISKKSSTSCGEAGSDTLFVLEYVGKLLMGKEKNQPLVNQKVLLRDAKDTVVQTTVTNSYGDFTFKNLNANETYNINVPLDEKSRIKDQELYLAKVDGTIIKSFEKSGNKFSYKILPSELSTLSKEVEEDTELKIKNFGKSNKLELTVIEDIYYAPNSAEITEESQAILNKITNAMNQNSSLKLAISSHTDANGDDAYNMTLSEKRAKKVLEYMLSKGISKERLSAKGFGETVIKNRCKNGVDCSELEHELNRRTEFKFTK